MKKILIVEDDQSMSAALSYGFETQGFVAEVAKDGKEGLRLALEKSFDLLILDVMLPALSGLDVCRQLRRDGYKLPIIMLTARGQEVDKVLGLKLGADDYVTKPFSFMELLARVEAILRRTGRADFQPGYNDCYQFGDVFLDFKKLEAAKAGKPL